MKCLTPHHALRALVLMASEDVLIRVLCEQKQSLFFNNAQINRYDNVPFLLLFR